MSKSRPARWADAASRAVSALEELEGLQAEYQEWIDNLPENMQSGATAEKLQSIVDLDITGAKDTAEEAGNVELPRGFGRD